MKLKLITLFVLLTSCGGSGGGGGSASNSPISGSWLEQLPNPAYNIYVAIGGSSFTIQQSTCTITGNYTVDANFIHVTNANESPACAATSSSFDCTYSMSSNNQLSISCPNFSSNLQRQ